MSYEQVTSLNTAKSLTVPAAAVGALLQAESQNVRFRTDGTAPTASVGMILYAGDPPVAFYGVDGLNRLQAIEVSASAKLNVTYLYS